MNNHFSSQTTAYGDNEFGQVKMAPPDPILSLTTGFKSDKDPKKVNLGVGAYRDDKGKPYVFPIVKKAEMEVVNDPALDKEYAPIDGVADFIKGSKMVAFGWDNPEINSGRIVSS